LVCVEIRHKYTQQLTEPQSEVKSADDLFGPGAAPGTVATDLEQATGIERVELLGKMEGIDIFDMKPLEMTRQGWSPLNLVRLSG
jgi:cytochrome c oxidase subunit 5b